MRYFQGGPEVTASLASPNIHHCVYALHFNCVLQYLHLFINCFSRITFLALAQEGPKKSIHGPLLEMFGDPWSREIIILFQY